jgi:hypothetical protein
MEARIMNYLNFDLDAFDYKPTETGERFSVRVASSPAGEQRISDADRVSLPTRVRQKVGPLQRRQLPLAEMIALGEELGAALFPPRVRSFLDASLNRLRSGEEGLRIRLRLDTYALAELPWEYVYSPLSDVSQNRRGPEGFLVLDRRISLVRYELQGQPLVSTAPGTGPLRLVALLASPDDPNYPPLDVTVEQRSIQQAVSDLPDFQVDFYTDATAESLLDALIKPAHIFHFSGHGEFKGDMGDRYGSQEGAGAVILLGDDRRAKPFPAQKLALNLSGRSVRLAVLTACEVGQRDAVNAWAGVVTALTHAGIPAVVGMQYRIRDKNALAFSRAFYRTLAAGQPIDAAVTDGRIAIFNRGDENERDWGVPVLYLRAVDGMLFPQMAPKPITSGGPTPPGNAGTKTAPKVIATEPANGQTGITRNLAAVKITFDRDMQADKHGIQAGPGGAFGMIQARVDYDAATRTFAISRDNATVPLPPNTLISFDVNVPATPNDFADLAGTRAEPYRFSFTTEGGPVPGPTTVDVRTLRQVMIGAFSATELEMLCNDVQLGLADAGIMLQVNLDIVGGGSKAIQVLNLIQYLDRRGYLGYLVKAVREARPGLV